MNASSAAIAPGSPPSPAASPTAFLDSNVWLYALAGGGDPRKQPRANALLAGSRPAGSTQVVHEVTNNLLKKYGWTEPRVRAVIGAFYRDCQIVQHDQALQLDASDLRERYGFSPYDGLIVAALRSGVSILYSEDMHPGLVVRGSLTVVDPFAAPPAAAAP